MMMMRGKESREGLSVSRLHTFLLNNKESEHRAHTGVHNGIKPGGKKDQAEKKSKGDRQALADPFEPHFLLCEEGCAQREKERSDLMSTVVGKGWS